MSETSYIILSVALFFGMILVQSLVSIKHHGLVPLAGARDEMKAPTFLLERMKRANQNMIEAMVMFVPLTLIVIHTDQLSMSTAVGAAMFFWGRLVYAPLYWFGVSWFRTVAWGVSMAGIALMFINLLPLI